MPVTTSSIVSAIKAIHTAKDHEVVTSQTFDTETGTTSNVVETKNYLFEEDMEALVTSIVEGILTQFLAEGIEVGDSTASTLDVG